MIAPDGQPILTAAQMRAAEQRAIDAGASVASLMERAGSEVARSVRRLAAGAEVLILCGPGNNGGDGYVAARVLAASGHRVRVAAAAEPKSEASAWARAGWTGPIEPWPDPLAADSAAPVIIDAVFGTGLSRAIDDDILLPLNAMVQHARLSIAVDVPSGVATDTGTELNRSQVPTFDLTLALGALKPAHVIQPAASLCGNVRLLDIGLSLVDRSESGEHIGAVKTIARPRLRPPEPWSHKYTRGMVAVVSGRMHGASELAASAAYRSGAGYVLLLTGGLPQSPHAIVRRAWSADALDDTRIGAVVIGPGLGRDDRAREKLAVAIASDRPLVLDGDALHLLDLDAVRGRVPATILTPHAGEFDALFGKGDGGKIERTREAARRAGAVVVHKGADTVVAAPDGSTRVAVITEPRLAVAGTGDVLAGTIGTMLAQQPHDPRRAASAGVWCHTEAARLLGRPFIADDLIGALPRALAAATVRVQ